jgi:hypothetical protein
MGFQNIALSAMQENSCFLALVCIASLLLSVFVRELCETGDRKLLTRNSLLFSGIRKLLKTGDFLSHNASETGKDN